MLLTSLVLFARVVTFLAVFAGPCAAESTASTNPNLRYFSIWDLDTGSIADLKGWNNFLFTSANTSEISAYHAAGLGSSLLNVRWVLFNASSIWPDVETRWNATLQETVLPLLAKGALFGVFLGDELCWACIPYVDLARAASLVRATLPPAAIVYYNEAYPVFTDGKCIDGTPIAYPSVPAGVTWVSIDYYPNEGTFQGAQAIYRNLLFPRMAAHQAAIWVPPAYDAPPAHADALCCSAHTRDGANPPCQGNCTRAMLDWARESYNWVRSDSRFVGLTPWHYSTYAPGQDFNPGLAQMPALLQLWRAIGAEIVSGRLGDV